MIAAVSAGEESKEACDQEAVARPIQRSAVPFGDSGLEFGHFLLDSDARMT
jgi:hypothetical protein